MTALVKTIRLSIATVLGAFVVVTMATAAQPESGTARIYNDKFEGKKTSSGEIYDKAGLTAAHKKLPYGTKVKVTNAANGKSVVVTINDRLAASSHTVIDVSRHAAEELGFVKSGKTKVTLEVQ